jgi:hypothetical protein
MQAKIIMLEYKGSSLDTPMNKMNALQNKYEKLVDSNVRRVIDIQKLRSALVRLKSDLHVLQITKKVV